MTLVKGDKIVMDPIRHIYSDHPDFEELTGQDFTAYVEGMQATHAAGAFGIEEMASLEFKALVWVIMRDDATRSREYQSVDEMKQVMQRDMRTLGMADLEAFLDAIQDSGGNAVDQRASRQQATASQGIDGVTRELLSIHGFRTEADIAGASDAELLKIKGLGRVRLGQIRRAQKTGALV